MLTWYTSSDRFWREPNDPNWHSIHWCARVLIWTFTNGIPIQSSNRGSTVKCAKNLFKNQIQFNPHAVTPPDYERICSFWHFFGMHVFLCPRDMQGFSSFSGLARYFDISSSSQAAVFRAWTRSIQASPNFMLSSFFKTCTCIWVKMGVQSLWREEYTLTYSIFIEVHLWLKHWW